MAKQIKEVEVEFPDCDICGRDIGTEEYLDLVTVVSKRRHADDGSEFPPRFNDHCSLSICKRCISRPGIWQQRLYEVVDETIKGQHRY
jgi:hypothetical protein